MYQHLTIEERYHIQAYKKMDIDLENRISEGIKKDWSPEQVFAMLKIKDNMTIPFVRIS